MDENERWQQAQQVKCYLQIWLSGEENISKIPLVWLKYEWRQLCLSMKGWFSPFVQHLIVTIRKAVIVSKFTTVIVITATITTNNEEEEEE